MYKLGRSARLFFFGPPLTKFTQAVPAVDWSVMFKTYSPAKEAALKAWGAQVYACIYDSSDDAKNNYDRVAFSLDKKAILADLRQGEWSEWLPITLVWNNVKIKTSFRIEIIKLDPDGFYKIRFFYNNINKTVTNPEYLDEAIEENVGPMVDSVDNFPPQLVFYDEDKTAFLQEAKMSLQYHKNLVSYFLKTFKPDVFLHDIYTPNQMLTSRWWMGYLDPAVRTIARKQTRSGTYCGQRLKICTNSWMIFSGSTSRMPMKILLLRFAPTTVSRLCIRPSM